MKQFDAKDLFQLANLMADRGRCQVELRSSIAEMKMTSGGLESPKCMQGGKRRIGPILPVPQAR